MRFKFLSLFAALALLAACETAQQQSGTSGGTGGSTAQAPSGVSSSPQTSGQAQQQTRRPPAEQLAAIGDRVFFDFDRHNLKPDAQGKVRDWAAFLRDNPQLQVLLEGNADERGTREYNLALGDRRANSARDYLVSLGIDSRRIRTISYGKERPISTGSNEEAWARNRNVHIVVN